MFDEYESEDHREKATAILNRLGKFVVAFEDICAAMRSCLDCAFRREGLKNQSLSQAVTNGLSIFPLRRMLGSVFNSLNDQDDEDQQCVNTLLQQIEKLAEQRNRFMHSEWYLNYDYDNADDKFVAMTLSLKSGERTGPTFATESISAAYLDDQITEAKKILVLLHRLGICLNQSGFKVHEMFAKPM